MYECPYCGGFYPTWQTLRAHIDYYHPEEAPPLYTCPQCGAVFESEAGLASHIETFHPPAPPPPPPPPPGEYYGSVVKKELEYNESRGIIPVAGVLQNKRGLFHVTARNDMSTSQPIGIYWFINDPDTMIAEEYTDWKFGTLGPGQTHEFIGGRFTFSKVGKYGTWVDLLMGSQSNPVVIYSARYSGELCTVGAPVYKGSIARKELEYDSVRGTIPVY